jgi:hypothetical protein
MPSSMRHRLLYDKHCPVLAFRAKVRPGGRSFRLVRGEIVNDQARSSRCRSVSDDDLPSPSHADCNRQTNLSIQRRNACHQCLHRWLALEPCGAPLRAQLVMTKARPWAPFAKNVPGRITPRSSKGENIPPIGKVELVARRPSLAVVLVGTHSIGVAATRSS